MSIIKSLQLTTGDLLNFKSSIHLFYRLPDDDRDICFFDYYVDEAGEWDPWTSR